MRRFMQAILSFANKGYIHSICGQISYFPSKPKEGTPCPKCWVAIGDWSEA